MVVDIGEDFCTGVVVDACHWGFEAASVLDGDVFDRAVEAAGMGVVAT